MIKIIKLNSLIAITLIAASCSQESESQELNSPQNSGISQTENNYLFDMNEPQAEEQEWITIFEDYFEGDSETPDPDKWVLCKKGHDSWNRYLSESYAQAYQKDGILYLEATLENGEYLTGGIETLGKFDFQYGKVECRARFARAPKGGHTGIWMMPAPPAEQWPKSGEIDIMEHLDQDVIYQTVHSWYLDDMDIQEPKGREIVKLEDIDGWNIYGLEWTPEKLTYYVNGKAYLEYTNLQLSGADGAYQWPFNHPFYIILSQSLGGEDTWAGPIDDSELPAVFEIDWIKVMQTPEEAGVPQITL